MIYHTMKFKEAYQHYFNLEENSEIWNRLSFVSTSLDGESYIILATKNDLVVGVYAFENYNENTVITLYIQVDENYKNQGIATQLTKELFVWAKENKKDIISSQFSKDGQKYMKHKLLELAPEYNVRFYLSEDEFDWFN